MAVKAELELDDKKFKAGAKRASDDVNRLYRDINRGATTSAKSFSAISGSVATLATGLGIAAAAFVTLKRSFAESAQIETLKVQFEVLTGSVQRAEQHVRNLVEFAAYTPFEIKDISNASRILQSFGFYAFEAEEKLKTLGDISAITGKRLNELAVIYGQVAQEGKLTGERLRQFFEAGIPVSKELAKVLGVNEQALRKMVTEGRVGFKHVE